MNKLLETVSLPVFLLCMTGAPVLAQTTTAAQADTTKTDTTKTGTTKTETAKAAPAKPDTPVQDVVVEDKKPQVDEQGGFRPQKTTLGPLGEKSIQDVPYSVNVMTQDMIQDRQATSLNDLLKYIPSTQMEARGGLDVGRPQSRGMEGSVVDNNHIDGFNAVATTAQPIEMFDRVEVINGLTGALYGPASPAGQFNSYLKRPTADYLNQVDAGITGDGAWMTHVDVGGSPSDRFGYRVNALSEEGGTYGKDSYVNRKLVGGAFDIHPTDDTTVQLNAYYYHWEKYGTPGGFSYASGTLLPSASTLDPARAGYGQSWAGSTLDTYTESAKIIHDFNDDWHLTLGVMHQEADRTLLNVSNTINKNGTFTQTVSPSGATAMNFDILSNQATVNGTFDTWGIRHDIVVGTTGYVWDTHSGTTSSTKTLGTSYLDDPTIYGEPTLLSHIPLYRNNSTILQNAILGDTITWNRYFQTMLMGSENSFDVSNYGTSGVRTGYYNKTGPSSTVAMMFKPIPQITTYIAYSDTLEAGSMAPTGAKNAGEELSPVRSRETELGIKGTLGVVDASAAIFRIDRPLAYTDANNYYGIAGMQQNDGFEFNLGGSVFDNLRLLGGVTYMDPTLNKAEIAADSGKLVVGVPRLQANLLAEYQIPGVEGLSINGNVHYVGKRAADAANSAFVGEYTTLDLGAKYVDPDFYGHNLTLRFIANNVTNRRYWASVFPGNIYGGGGTSTAFLGDPMGFRLTATLRY